MIKPRRGTGEKDQKLNKMYAAAFKTGAGKAVLNHLKQISIYAVGGPGITPDHLMHIEGQRFIVAEIERRITLGKEPGDESS
tara:strand:- start:26 stop:271 length:246 start_codon:yes stop_codon:yes gene_type:complete